MENMKNRLEQGAEEFVEEYRGCSDEEISKMVAGITAIIEGNEAAYEHMKDQKWFERIWYGITLKNKATVKEMQEKRDELTKYAIQILIKMNSMLDDHSRCIFDLYRAVAVIRQDMDVLSDEVNLLAHKLNEKIISVDQYYWLINEIRNDKFDINKPLLSLIDIMSFIDSRTAKDTAKLIQLKETMEKVGFDFSEKIGIEKYSEEIMSLPEDSVGRILLFCQNFSNNSRFLAYTCSLMENYYYRWESDRRVIRENGEAVEDALKDARLTSDANCVVKEMFDDLKSAVPKSFEPAKIDVKKVAQITPAEYFSSKSTRACNVIVTGMTGSGKTTLINSIFGWKCESTGKVKSSSKNICTYSNDKNAIYMHEAVGFEIGNGVNETIISDISTMNKDLQDCVLWYCVNVRGNRIDIPTIKKVHSLRIPMVIVLTQSVYDENSLEEEISLGLEEEGIKGVPIVSVLAKEYVKPVKLSAYGLEELIDQTISVY